MESDPQETEHQGPVSRDEAVKTNGNTSQPLFPESPVYEPEEEVADLGTDETSPILLDDSKDDAPREAKDDKPTSQSKRKLSDEGDDNNAKIQKLDTTKPDSAEFSVNTQKLDEEVSEIISAAKKLDDILPSRVRTPVRSSPRLKRSNSADITKPKTPRTPKSRPASVDITKERKTPKKLKIDDKIEERPSIDIIKEPKLPETIAEESGSEMNDSQNFHLVLSPTTDDDVLPKTVTNNYSSDPVLVKDREETISPGKVNETRSEGYNYPDQSSNLSQKKRQDLKTSKGKTTDQESTDSVESIPSPDVLPTVTSKLISKLSNGNSSTPTELSSGKHDSDSTPEMMKLTNNLKRGKNESFRVSNNTTPSTISPLQNGHGRTDTLSESQPVFDVLVNYNEDGEFLSLYVVKTDNDLGLDMCKEYQRFSKRFTIDPYLGDVSVSTSPSSVTSTGMINLPINRTSFASTVSSTSSSSNRTSDGAFVVPQPPRKSVVNPTSSVKGFDAVLKKVHDVLTHAKESFEGYRSCSDEKISVGVQTTPSSESLSNGNLSPEESCKTDKATPKSSLKKTRVRGRRNLSSKTKRNILPTQAEEPEYMHGMNSPEMVPTNGDEKMVKSPKSEKPLSSLVATPKSVSKLKQKRRPTSPRPATPVEKSLVKTEYPGFAPDTAVLAKWVDKRYYSGKVLEITEPNKYLIKFDDGQSKVLLDDFIIFGDTKTLPLHGQSVYAMVDEEQNYEPGLVLGVEENDSGTVTYRCTTDGDTVVMVTASELYLTEDQARSLKESSRPRSPTSPATPRRRHHRELDLDNIIQGPRSARSRDKGSSSTKKRVASPKSPKASTSGLKTKSTPVSRKRLASESSEISESSNSAPPVRLEEVAGVEPEVQRTPRKIDGVKGKTRSTPVSRKRLASESSEISESSNSAPPVRLEEVAGVEPEVQRTPRKIDGVKGKTRSTPVSRKRLASESSEISESSNSAPPVRLEEVAGVEPEVQRTPRKIDGVKGKTRSTPVSRKRLASESSEISESSNSAPPVRLEEVAGVEPEVQRTPRKIDGVKGKTRSTPVSRKRLASESSEISESSNSAPPVRLEEVAGVEPEVQRTPRKIDGVKGKTKSTPVSRKRLASESSEISESSNSAPPVRLEEVAGVEPEVQRTPRKIDGVKGKTRSTPVSRKRLASESSEISESSNSAPPVRLEEVAGVEPEVQRTPRKIDGVKGKTRSTPVSRKRLASESSEISESSNSAPPVRLEEVAGVEPEVQRTPRKIDGVKGKTRSTPVSRKRLASESSEISESSNSAPPVRLEEVAGVEPEVQRTPRKIDGVKAGPLQLKGAAKQNIGKKNSKLTKFENDEDTVSTLGPIPGPDSKLFAGLHFLLTCTDTPKKLKSDKCQDTRHYSSEEDGETTAGTDCEDLEFSDRPFNKERLKEQLEAGGGIVYSHFDDVPKAKYGVTKLIAPRPCLTAKYIQSLAADIRSVTHQWVIMCCTNNTLLDTDAYAMPAGWSITKQAFVNWVPSSGRRNTQFFKDKVILLCGDQDTFVKFWERVCTLVGATTRVVNEEDLNMSGAYALVTDWDCPHEVQNKANQDNIPLVSTTWVVQCLIEAKVIQPTSHDKFSFMYTEPE